MSIDRASEKKTAEPNKYDEEKEQGKSSSVGEKKSPRMKTVAEKNTLAVHEEDDGSILKSQIGLEKRASDEGFDSFLPGFDRYDGCCWLHRADRLFYPERYHYRRCWSDSDGFWRWRSEGSRMKYTLITKNGKVMTFFVKAVAELYQTINGGVVVTEQILEMQSEQVA